MQDDLEGRVANLLRYAMAEAFDGAPHLLAILDAIPVCVSYVDSGRVYRFANRTYEAWFNCSREDIVGRTVMEVVGKRAYVKARHHLDRVLAGEPVQFNDTFDYGAAGSREVMATLVPDTRTDGAVRGYFALVQDTGRVDAPTRPVLRLAK